MKKRVLKDNKKIKDNNRTNKISKTNQTNKINRTNNNINSKIIIILAIIILIIALLFVVIKLTGNVTGQVTGEITGDATSTALYNCTDSDNGIFPFIKGICEDKKQKYEDTCYGKKGMWEYYCPRDKYACVMQETACPYGCEDGVCLKKGESVSNLISKDVNQTNIPPETFPEENIDTATGKSPDIETGKNSYLIISVILIIAVLIFVGWLFFRKKSTDFRKGSVKLKWR